MTDAFICDGVRTPIGRYGGALSSIRTDDLAALPITALMERNKGVDWAKVDDVIYGSANQAGEDNRNVARMAALLAGLPKDVPGATINRLCASGMDAVGTAARGIKAGDYDLSIAGGVESMSRAPFVMPKATSAFTRANAVYDTTIGWRFINPKMKESYGVDSMPQTADNVAADYGISREDQDAFALGSLSNALAAQESGAFEGEITEVTAKTRKGEVVTDTDEQPGAARPDKIPTLKPAFRADGTVTAANASSISDGAAALVLASEEAAAARGLPVRGHILGHASHAQAPGWFTTAPVPAARKLLTRIGWDVEDVDLWEVNEAFAVVPMAFMREMGVPREKINVNGGACALGHPIGASGARIMVTLLNALEKRGLQRGIAAICIGGGEGTAIAIERV